MAFSYAVVQAMPRSRERRRRSLMSMKIVLPVALEPRLPMIKPYFLGMEFLMELRHLRYFVAVAEEGSLTNAAERRLHTAQPSLSRQIRDLELEVGVKLLERGARGIELTPAGRTFLDHARLALLQVEAAGDAARRVAQPQKAAFVIGFLTGAEVMWLPEALRILREEQPGIEITLFSQSSPDLAGALMRGKVARCVPPARDAGARANVQVSDQGTAGCRASQEPSSRRA